MLRKVELDYIEEKTLENGNAIEIQIIFSPVARYARCKIMKSLLYANTWRTRRHLKKSLQIKQENAMCRWSPD